MPDNTIAFNDLDDSDKLQTLIAMLGKEKLLVLCDEFGGASLYVPKKETVLRTIRNEAIIKEFKTGSSLNKLRKKYKMSETQIRAIVFEK